MLVDDETDRVMQRIGRLLKSRFSAKEAGEVEHFVRAYYEHTPPQDLREEDPGNLVGAALAHRAFASSRKPGRAKVRVYNPDVAADGWKSGHTIIEIVTDDMPFLVDSVTSEANRLGLAVHVAIHPIVAVRRAASGQLVKLAAGRDEKGAVAESFMRVAVNHQSGDRLAAIQAAIESVLKDVRRAVADWQAMRKVMRAITGELAARPAAGADAEATEARAFLEWLLENHFTFLGYREYAVAGSGERATLSIQGRTGLGVLADPKVPVFKELKGLRTLPPIVSGFIRTPNVLLVVKSSLRSTIHRPVVMDAIGIKTLDAKGKVIGMRLFVGLFTSAAYNRSPRDIPMLRRKIATVFERAGFSPASHDGKALMNILETFPRDELLQISDSDLLRTARGILNLQDRQRLALFVRRDDFGRFVSCLVYVPRDRYTTDLRLRLQEILERAFGGKVVSHFAALGDSALARLQVTVETEPGKLPSYDLETIEADLAEATRSWSDRLEEALIEGRGEEEGLRLFHRYEKAFPAAYRERVAAPAAIADILEIEAALASGVLGLSLLRRPEAGASQVSLKLFNRDRSIPLSDVLPMLEHMGFRVESENPYAVRVDGSQTVMIHDFGLATRDASPVEIDAIRATFREAFLRIWQGDMESDGFNALVMRAGLAWREIVVLRTYSRYLRQTGIPFSQVYMEQTLTKHPALARLLVGLFVTIFDPAAAADRTKRIERLRADIGHALDAVPNADEDRILRRFLNAIASSLRTNYFQTADGQPKSYLSIKLDSRALDELPLPKPLREIFVYSPRVEGVHLRFGLVARGGIRWSDRPEDYRTEVLGLVKAQQVKNAVIVPVGAKGGFVLKRAPASTDREAFQKEGVGCYKTFVRGLLDITDNLKGAKVIPPRDVVRLDPDDPYLVVAADKGTATFSDIANGISAEYDFWLDDAFASGGSAGYDHKKMAITSRGAWESVKRHFREAGVDVQTTPFTAVGVGDMSGDVFGNGMLRSPHTKLLAAFDHRQIFVDPDPDPAKSFAERQRLFNLPRSSWADYDIKVLSKGGKIYERTAKSLAISPETKKAFGLTKDNVTPNELMQAILKAQVDLFFLGGIGTFVKASTESHAEVGDRTNDAIRVNATDLRCKVVGEGANLGVTQRARIEYALRGGRINADSIDNSGGVDCSDHEVNIKILLNAVATDGRIKRPERDKLLVKMTDEVAALVLRDNYLQTQAITLMEVQGHQAFTDLVRMMRTLERLGRINRAVEYLPDDDTLAEREATRKGFTRPEIAVLMPHSKTWLYDELLDSDLPDDSQLHGDLVRYFPTPIQKKFAKDLGRHRLRREIIATQVANSMINRTGSSFVSQMMEKTGLPAVNIARAYIVTRDVFALREVWKGIEDLDAQVPAALQVQMQLEGNRLIERGTLWFLRHTGGSIDIGAAVAEFTDGVGAIADDLSAILPGHYRDGLHARADKLAVQGVPKKLALRVAGLINMASALDIVRLAKRHRAPVASVARLYFAVGHRFHLGTLRSAAETLKAENHWQQLASAALIEDLFANQGALASQILGATRVNHNADKAIDAWAKKRGDSVTSTESLLTEILAGETVDFSMLAVVSRRLQALTAGSV